MLVPLLLLSVVFGAFVFFLFRPDPPRLLGVYSKPGTFFYFKFLLAKFAIERRRRTSKSSSLNANLDEQQWGGDGCRNPREMEAKQVLPEGKTHAGDCVFFDGCNSDGFYFTLGTAQRPNDVMNLFFIVRIPNFGTFVSRGLHYNTNVASVRSDSHYKTACGFDVFCVDAMKRWRIRFEGTVVPDRKDAVDIDSPGGREIPEEIEGELPASFDFEWTNFGEHFDFDLECSSEAIARSLAIEPWSKKMFECLKQSHQVHYEQFGFLQGQITIGDKVFENIRLTSMRDHTITAYRSWSDLRRYIMLIFHLEDGTCIHTSIISMPEVVFSHLEFGYVILPDKTKLPVDRINLSLANLGEDKKFPKAFGYSFEAGGRHFDCRVRVIETTTFRMGLEQRCFVAENMCKFEVNGLKGFGFAECEYRIAPY
ncbi:hypothetical protein QR680_004016 [Steinernema hermaphroditum]|uniref:DUF7064 domain-containing protein n=1 Tax=Steinernema hermaphroditum TaxID=289476 RepID=A0AA39LT29_9BILA|nr:hypothetical protein QR680_004016 [Steinernema hermaphroditum]